MTAHDGIGRQVKSGVAYSFIGRAATSAVVFVGTVVLARLLEVRDFGVVQLCFMLVDFATKVGDFGFVTALVQQRDEVRGEQINTLFLIDVSLKVVLFTGLMIGLGPIAIYFHEPRLAEVLPAIGVYMIVDSFSAPSLALLSRAMRFDTTARIEFASRTAEVLAAVLLAVLEFGVWSLVLSRILGSVLTSVLAGIAARWRPTTRFDLSASMRLVRFGGWLFLRNLFYYIGDNIDYFFIGRYLGAQQVGFYSKAFEIMRLPQARMTRALNSVLFTAFSRMQDDPVRVGRGVQKAILLTSLLTYPALTGLALVAPEFVSIVFGQKWTPMTLPLQIMCVAGMLHAVDPFVVSVLTAMGNVRMATLRRFLELALLVGFIRVGVQFGVIGVAIAVVAVSILMAGLMAVLVRTVGLNAWRDYFRPQAAALAATAVMAAAVTLARHFTLPIGLAELARFGLLVGVGAATYCGALLLARPTSVVELWHELREDLRAFLRRALGVLRRDSSSGEPPKGA